MRQVCFLKSFSLDNLEDKVNVRLNELASQSYHIFDVQFLMASMDYHCMIMFGMDK
jgi:hypothetical protein